MSSQSPKSLVFAQFARIGKALSSGIRLEMLELLAQGERSVDALATALGYSLPNVSQHLQQLRHAGLVVARKQSQFVYYRIAGDDVVRLVSGLQAVGEAHLAEVDKLVRTYLEAKDNLEPVPAAELLERARRGLVTVIDVRPAEEYAAGHLPGAINVPLSELENRLSGFSRRKEVIAYCRGPYCLMSFEAVQMLRARGFKARRMEAGLPEWRGAGLPVDVEPG